MIFAPLINDITTTYPQPPQFVAIAKSRPESNYAYPDVFFEKQKAYYEHLDSLKLAVAPNVAFDKVVALARQQKDWVIIAIDAMSRRLEATSTTALLRFKDDVVVEVRTSGVASEIHMRSKSRVGKGDFGANAKRIQNFLSQLK
jgi:uncharacterized protein (DUF1499 family)